MMPETNTGAHMNTSSHLGYSRLTSLEKLLLPVRLPLSEPIVLAICLFLSVEYSILYLFFQLIPKLFTEAGYIGTKNSSISFAPFAVGTIAACLSYIMASPVLAKAAAGNRTHFARPERRRLPPAYLGGFLIVLSLFLMGYSLARRVNFIGLLVLQGIFAYGLLLIFIGLTNYVVDSYQVQCPIHSNC
jgi:hypothetical protein